MVAISVFAYFGERRLRHPRFIGLRDDKPARRMVREAPQ
jgi:hypothetical protein